MGERYLEKKRIMKRALFCLLMLAFGLTVSAQSEKGTASVSLEKEPIYTVVEQDPEFPGGMEKLYQFIAANVQYPEACKEERIRGTVFVTFVIEMDGSINNIKILRDPDPERRLGEEAVRVVKMMPKWKPGKAQGKKVRVQYNLPFKFSLN